MSKAIAKKSIIAGTIALSLAGGGLALAQSRSDGGPDAAASPRAERDFRPSAEDRAAFADARIAGLKAGLRLNAEQEKSWPAVETALRNLAKLRAERRQEFADRARERGNARGAGNDDAARPDLYQRLRRAADRMSERAGAFKQLADAAEPLYNSLDDGQKRRLAMMMRMGERHGHDGWRRSRYDDEPRGWRRWRDDDRGSRGWHRDDDEMRFRDQDQGRGPRRFRDDDGGNRDDDTGSRDGDRL